MRSKFLDRNRFVALCLNREEPRQFYLDRCQNVRLALAAEFLMPVELSKIGPVSPMLVKLS